MTKDEFEKMVAPRLWGTVEKMYEDHLEGILCDCGEEICKGWRIGDPRMEDTD